MALSRSAAFQAAQAAQGVQPVFLVEIPSASIYLSTRAIQVGTQTYTPIIDKLQDGGISGFTRGFNERAQPTIGQLAIRIANPGLYSTIVNSATLDNAQALLKFGFNSTTAANYITLMDGVIDTYSIAYDVFELFVYDRSLKNRQTLAAIIGQKYFRGAASGKGEPIPILLGRVLDLATYQVETLATDSILAADVGTGDTTIYLVELDNHLPEAGDIQIGGTEDISYTTRTVANLEGVTVLALGGLTRGSPATHSAGDAVTHQNPSRRFLVSYEAQAVNSVRDSGVVQSSGFSTALAVSGEADRDVTIITFTSQPSGAVTVDADGLNLDLTNLISSNPGFESGDFTGWTNGGATNGVVDSNEVFEGTYSAELQGDLLGGASDTLYRDITTTIGQRYEIMLWLKNDFSALYSGGYITNGSFETGDLTGWTTEAGATVSAEAGGVLGGSYYCKIVGLEGTFVGIYQDVSVTPNDEVTVTFFHGRGGSEIGTLTGRLLLGTPADPDAYASQEFSPPLFFPGVSNAGATITPTSGTLRITIQAKWETDDEPWLGIDHVLLRHDERAITTLKAGPTGDPDADLSKTINPTGSGRMIGAAFTASDTTTRFTIESLCYAETAFKSYIDKVSITTVSSNPAAVIRYLLNNFTSYTLDDMAFNAAETFLGGWAFGGVITENLDALETAQRMGYQCRSRVYFDASNQLTIKPYGATTSSSASFTVSNIAKGTLRVDQSSLDDIYTEIRVWFAPRAGSSEPADFQAVTYANPSEDTHDGEDLAALCSAASTTYGITRTLDVYANMINDFDTANKLLSYLVNWHTSRKYIVSFETFHNAIHIEEFDVVTITHPVLPSAIAGGTFEVMQKSLSPASIRVGLVCWQLLDI